DRILAGGEWHSLHSSGQLPDSVAALRGASAQVAAEGGDESAGGSQAGRLGRRGWGWRLVDRFVPARRPAAQIVAQADSLPKACNVGQGFYPAGRFPIGPLAT